MNRETKSPKFKIEIDKICNNLNPKSRGTKQKVFQKIPYQK